MDYFGSSGIRGIINEKITPELCLKVGRAVGSEYKRVIIGTDPRTTADMVKSAVISGLTASGADVKDAGMVPTPTLAQAADDFDCGVMITASHNPSEYNGIKLWNPDGSSFNTEQMLETEKRIKDQPDLPTWKEVGKLDKYRNAVDEHIDKIKELIGKNLDSKVVLDCANGAGCSVTPFLFRELGCDVVTLNSNPDGTFPAHDPEPVESHLKDLGKAVKNTDADIGIAHDGDADRMVAFDENGDFLDGDKLLALFAKQFKESVVVPVNSSMIIEELVDNVIRSKVGDVYVAEELKKHDAQFGGEPSGTWIFPEISYAPDGIYAAAFLIKLSESLNLTEEIQDLPSYPRKKESIQAEKKKEIMNTLKKFYEDSYESERLNFVDGIRLDYEKGWALIRASGTEPKIRITSEAKDQKYLNKIFEESKKNLSDIKEEI
uniref:Phosphoglucomutase/phosphomannomutase n=1 Tax=uncultured organism TaxID=155900 RepID=M1Q2Y1_9ZZZZ|nr:phosphoglucomutase/phosphomannomutase [uncultured organism]